MPTAGEGGNRTAIGYIDTTSYSPLTVDYHEGQLLDQLNHGNRAKLSGSEQNTIPVPTNLTAFDRYAYAFNNPILNSDPTGHNPLALFLIPVAVITAVAILGVWVIYGPDAAEQAAEGMIDLGQDISQSVTDNINRISLGNSLPRAGEFPYNPPKQKGNPPYVRGLQGSFVDESGNVWKRDKSGHGGPHWDVVTKDGKHLNVNDEGDVIKEEPAK